MEEFQEADMLWPDVALAHNHGYHRPADSSHGRCRQHLTDQPQQPRPGAAVVHPLQSSPVRIPSMPPMGPRPTSRGSWTRSYKEEEDDDDDGAEEVGVVPPHVLAARRCAEERRVASSVCVGHGRTLKGRDLRAVRNAVLHMTGFLSSSDK
jgi:hypothetical protein